jgi:glycosyltransferase involved in cell wall biosynthesis
MKIGIIATNYIPGSAGGVETYLRNLIMGLQKIDAKDIYYIFVPNESRNIVNKLISDNRFEVVGLSKGPAIMIRALRRTGLYGKSNEQLLARKINDYGLDVAHFPFQEEYPSGINAKKVVTFHDLQHEHYPHFFTTLELEGRKKVYGQSIDSADKIIAISEFTKKDIGDVYGKSAAAKTNVVYQGFDPIFFQSQVKLPSTLKKVQPYFYYPAATWPHKNHLRLIEAFASFLESHSSYYLVLSGISKQNQAKIQNKITELGISKNVQFLGYLKYEDLPVVYKGALALVFPSLFEGFGIPILEAMASGCPILAADNTSIPEVVGQAGLLFDATDTKSIESCLMRIADSPQLLAKFRSAGKQRVKKFSLTIMASQTLKIYESLGDRQ